MKIINTIIIIFCIILFIPQSTYALGDIMQTGKKWETDGKANAAGTIDTTTLSETSGKLYNLLLAVATVVAIIVGAILGVQFMTAGIDQRVKVKESLFPYLISCIVVFGSLGIWKLVVAVMKNI